MIKLLKILEIKNASSVETQKIVNLIYDLQDSKDWKEVNIILFRYGYGKNGKSSILNWINNTLSSSQKNNLYRELKQYENKND